MDDRAQTVRYESGDARLHGLEQPLDGEVVRDGDCAWRLLQTDDLFPAGRHLLQPEHLLGRTLPRIVPPAFLPVAADSPGLDDPVDPEPGDSEPELHLRSGLQPAEEHAAVAEAGGRGGC